MTYIGLKIATGIKARQMDTLRILTRLLRHLDGKTHHYPNILSGLDSTNESNTLGVSDYPQSNNHLTSPSNRLARGVCLEN